MNVERRAIAAGSRSPFLLNGVSWGGFGLVALLYGIWTLQWAIKPVPLAWIGSGAELVLSWLVFWAVMLVGGTTLFVSVTIALNVSARLGVTSAWIVVPAAFFGSVVASLVSESVGAAPTGLDTAAGGIAGAAFWADWAAAIAVGYITLLRLRAAKEAESRLEVERRSLVHRQMEARLDVLRAQIEPHFLFNTLSNIRRLCQSDVAAGRAMLAQLGRYLRAALPKMRRDEATLAEELELARDYLALLKIRMGPRLEVSMAVSDDALAVPVPTMMLVTLAENAIKHGIAPLPEGGRIHISASLDRGQLILSVADTGRGFVTESGGGVGLSNIRARLAALYGDAAALRMQGNVPAGVIASIVLPLPAGPRSA